MPAHDYCYAATGRASITRATNRQNGRALARAIRRFAVDEIDDCEFRDVVNAAAPHHLSPALESALDDSLRCDDCGHWCDCNEMSTIDDRDANCVCESCREDNCSTCCACNEMRRVDDTQLINGDTFCDSCANEMFVSCERCGDYVSADDYLVVDDCVSWCQECADNYASYCEGAGGYVTEPCDDSDCESCYREDSDGIAEYNVTHCKALGELPQDRCACHVLGAELEMEVDDPRVFATELADSYSRQQCHCKRDGSLNSTSGVEVVTGHGTIDALMPILNTAAALARKHNGKSHDGADCGLHIGLDRSQLSGAVQAKIIVFWNSAANYAFLRQFTRRDYRDCGWCKIKSDKATADFIDSPALRSSDKYEIVNTCHATHLEFRGFRGSLLPRTLLACVSLVSLVATYCLSSAPDSKDLTAARFVAWLESLGDDARRVAIVDYLQNRNKSLADFA